MVGNMIGRVVTQQDDLGSLKSKHAVGLDPAAVVADAHTDDSTEGPPGSKTEITDFKITLLQILKRMVRMVVGVTG